MSRRIDPGRNKDFHYLWKCEVSPETRGRRKNLTKGCGHWNIHSTNNELTIYCRVQGTGCTACGRRPRLSSQNTEYYLTRDDVERLADERNESEFELSFTSEDM